MEPPRHQVRPASPQTCCSCCRDALIFCLFLSRRYGKGKLIDHDAAAAAAVAEGQPKPKKPKKTRKKLEPAHTAAPHSTDYAHSLLSGETPTSIMEKALKQVTNSRINSILIRFEFELIRHTCDQVTFTAILPGLYTVVEESTKQANPAISSPFFSRFFAVFPAF